MKITIEDQQNPQDLLAQVLRQRQAQQPAQGAPNVFNPASLMQDTAAPPAQTKTQPASSGELDPTVQDAIQRLSGAKPPDTPQVAGTREAAPLDDPFAQAFSPGITMTGSGSPLGRSGSSSRDKAVKQAYQPGYVGGFFNDVNQMARMYVATQKAAAAGYEAGLTQKQIEQILKKMNEAVPNTQNMKDPDFYGFMEGVARETADRLLYAEEIESAQVAGTSAPSFITPPQGQPGTDSWSAAGAPGVVGRATPGKLTPVEIARFNVLQAKAAAGKLVLANELVEYNNLLAKQQAGSGGGTAGFGGAGNDFVHPTGGIGNVTSDFGPRTAPKAGASTDHKGIDISAAPGTNILAIKDGTVVESGFGEKSGYYVVIQHADGSRSRYLHMQAQGIAKGTAVKGGQVIGQVGATGNVTGAHLHFELYNPKGEIVDPGPYLAGESEEQRAVVAGFGGSGNADLTQLTAPYTGTENGAKYAPLVAERAYAYFSAKYGPEQAMEFTRIYLRQINQESGFDPTVGSSAGALGIAQIVPEFHPGVDPLNVEAALAYSLQLMDSHLAKYGGDWAKALAAYNAGSGTVDRAIRECGAQWIGCLPEETQNYLNVILG